MTTNSTVPTATNSSSYQAFPTKSVLIGGSILILVVTALATVTAGRIHGKEFAPTHFSLREFEFFQIPIIRLQVSPIWRTGRSLDLPIYLMTAGLITVPKDPPSRWDLVGIMTTEDVSSFNGDAGLLVAWLTAGDQGGGAEHWKEWSQQHPEAAKELWGTVQSLAERELYVLIPQLFALAERETNVEKLRTSIAEYLTREQIAMAHDLVDAQSLEQARQLLTEALQDEPGNQLLSKALQVLPQTKP
jgi:hypothetical protein